MSVEPLLNSFVRKYPEVPLQPLGVDVVELENAGRVVIEASGQHESFPPFDRSHRVLPVTDALRVVRVIEGQSECAVAASMGCDGIDFDRGIAAKIVTEFVSNPMSSQAYHRPS